MFLAAVAVHAAQGGNAGSVRGTVTDPSGAVIPGATVHLTNAVSGLDRSITTDATGQFEFDNVPFNNYQLSVSATGLPRSVRISCFGPSVGTNMKLALPVARSKFDGNGRGLGRPG